MPEKEPREQLNIRMKPRRFVQAEKLAKIRGETKQAFFDRLVLEELRRNPEAVLGQIATLRAQLDDEEEATRQDLES